MEVLKRFAGFQKFALKQKFPVKDCCEDQNEGFGNQREMHQNVRKFLKGDGNLEAQSQVRKASRVLSMSAHSYAETSS